MILACIALHKEFQRDKDITMQFNVQFLPSLFSSNQIMGTLCIHAQYVAKRSQISKTPLVLELNVMAVVGTFIQTAPTTPSTKLSFRLFKTLPATSKFYVHPVTLYMVVHIVN